MKVHVWQSFSSNNSSAYRLVARFESAPRAAQVAEELRQVLARHAGELDGREEFDYDTPSETQRQVGAQHGFAWTSPLYWGDGGLAGDEPSVGVSGETMVLYHTYCGGLEEGLGEYLTARGARLETEDSSAPTVAVLLSLPPGPAGEQLQRGLAAFFEQRHEGKRLDDWKRPPWPTERHLPYSSPEEVLWFSDGETAAFRLPMDTGDLAGLEAYLKERGAADYRLLLCDEQLTDWLRILSVVRRCPACRGTSLKLLPAASEKLAEDQVLCRGCGGMFTLAAVAASLPVRKIADEALLSVRGLGDFALHHGASAGREQGEVLFVGGRTGSIYRSIAGAPFERVKKHGSVLYWVQPITEKVVLAVGGGPEILRSANGGGRWSVIKTGVTFPSAPQGLPGLFSICRAPGGAVFVSGTGAILRSTDDGKTWSPRPVSVKDHLMCVHAVDDSLLYAVGYAGIVLRSRDGGESWQKLKSGTKTSLCRVRGLSETAAVAVGDEGGIIYTADGGKTWAQARSKAKATIEDLTLGNDGRPYAVNRAGQVLVSSNRGKTWEVHPSGVSKLLWSICASPSGLLQVGTDDGDLVSVEDLDVPAAEGVAMKQAAAKKPAAKKPAPQKTAPKKTAPKKTAPKKTAPKKTAPKKTAPKKTAPKKTAPKKKTARARA